MHAYKIRRDEDYLPQRRAAAQVTAVGDAAIMPVASPARAMQDALAEELAGSPRAPGLSARVQLAIITGASLGLWAIIGAVVLAVW